MSLRPFSSFPTDVLMSVALIQARCTYNLLQASDGGDLDHGMASRRAGPPGSAPASVFGIVIRHVTTEFEFPAAAADAPVIATDLGLCPAVRRRLGDVCRRSAALNDIAPDPVLISPQRPGIAGY
jgi:hypothetical protein